MIQHEKFLMIAIIVITVTSLLFPFHIYPSFSQPIGMKMPPGMGHWRGEGRCCRASELNLSQEQAKELELLQQVYFRETQLLRAQLFSKRLELREILTNPNVKIESIRSKSSEINEIQSRFEEKALEYLIKVRSLLKPEQLKSWNPEEEFPLFRRMIHGPDTMGPMRPRKNLPSMERFREE